MSALDEVEARIRDCKSYNFGMRNADKLAHEDAPKMLKALRSVEALIRVLDKIQREDDVSKNACAGAVAIVIRNEIADALGGGE